MALVLKRVLTPGEGWGWVAEEESAGGALPAWMVATDGDPNQLAIDGAVAISPSGDADPLSITAPEGTSGPLINLVLEDENSVTFVNRYGMVQVAPGENANGASLQVGPKVGGGHPVLQAWNEDFDAVVFQVDEGGSVLIDPTEAGPAALAIDGGGAGNGTALQVAAAGGSALNVYDADASTSGVDVNAAVVKMPNLPITDPGVAGQLWNDGGTLMVSAG